jgi:ParB family chromosome partitioning protein
MAKMSGLGRGLNALFDDNQGEENSRTELKINEVEPNRNQPRRDFDDDALNELADSIAQYGIIQPLLVRPNSNGTYKIVAGERRWRAARIAGLKTVPAVIKELTDSEVMEIAMVENLQREDLNPVEEAQGYKVLMDDYKLTQEEVSKRVGKSRSAIANSDRLLSIPEKVLEKLKNGEISAGHAKAILMLSADKIDLALMLIAKGATVRDIENLAKEKSKSAKVKVKKEDKDITEIKLALSEELGRKVDVKQKGDKGIITIEYFSKEDLLSLAQSLGNKLAD